MQPDNNDKVNMGINRTFRNCNPTYYSLRFVSMSVHNDMTHIITDGPHEVLDRQMPNGLTKVKVLNILIRC